MSHSFEDSVNLYNDGHFTAALSQLDDDELSPIRYELMTKILIELDLTGHGMRLLNKAIEIFPQNGRLYYWSGVVQYLARSDFEMIAADFDRAQFFDFEAAQLGQGFLAFCRKEYKSAIQCFEEPVDDDDLNHARSLMLTQVYLSTEQPGRAREALREANQIWLQKPTVVRSHWQDLCEVRLMRAQGDFTAAEILLARLKRRVTESQKRLWRNIGEAERTLDKGAKSGALSVPREKVVQMAKAKGIAQKPVLNSLFNVLYESGPLGVSKEEISHRVWGESYNPTIHNDRIYKSIHRLKRAIGEENVSSIAQMGEKYVLWL